MAILTSGTLAVVLVAALVVAVTPRRSSNPLAISATTAPSVSQSIRPAAAVGDAEATDVNGRPIGSAPVVAVSAARISSFNAIPNAIAAVPAASTRSTADLPDLADDVLVLTDDVAYVVPWSDVALLSVDEATVIAADGSIVARFRDGHLVVTADSKVGAPLALPDD